MSISIKSSNMGRTHTYDIETLEDIVYNINEDYKGNENSPIFYAEININGHSYILSHKLRENTSKEGNQKEKKIENFLPITKEKLLEIFPNL